MEYSWLATLYSKFGAPHPRLSYFAVFLIGGLIFMGCWWLVGADYQRQDSIQGAVLRLSTRIDNLQSFQDGQSADRKKRKEARDRVSNFLTRGNEIKSRCESLEPQANLGGDAQAWADETAKSLAAIDPSYAARFESASGPTYYRSIGNKPLPEINNNVWNFVNLRTDALTRILETMPN